MKKIYAAALALLLSFGLKAQVCSPINLTQPGYSPDYLDTAEVGTSYDMVVHIRIPADTSVTMFGQTLNADIDSIRLVSVVNLPQGFSYQCNVSDCLFVPSQTYCAKISGTASSGQEGVYPLRLAIVAYASGVVFGTPTNFPPQPDTLDQFDLVVEGTGGTTGIYTITPKSKPLRVYPNPAHLYIGLWINAEVGETVSYTVNDVTGKQYFADKVLLKDGEEYIKLPSNNLAQGIYFVNLHTNKGIYTQRLVIEN